MILTFTKRNLETLEEVCNLLKNAMPTKKRAGTGQGKKKGGRAAAAKKEIDEGAECFKNDYLLKLIHRDNEQLQKFLKHVSVKEVRVLFKDMRGAEQDPDRENIFHPSLRCPTGEYAVLQLVKPYKGSST